MPSERATAGSLGRDARAASSRAMPLVFWADAAGASVSDATHAARTKRRERITWLLTIWIQHVFELHSVRVEIRIHVARAAVAILANQQLGRALDLATPVVHVFTEQRQHQVGVMLHRAHRTEIVERRTTIVPRRQMRQLRRREYRAVTRHGELLQP